MSCRSKITGKLAWICNKLCYENIVKDMYQPRDASSLGIIRFLFGLLMLIDISEERGGSNMDLIWGQPADCHFPLFSFLMPLPYPFMSLLYGIMWIGAFGIMIGFMFKASVLLFLIPYWYIFVLDKSFWNNHSYLFGVVALLLAGSSANRFLSIDALLDTSKTKHVPYWNYFILRYQFFMLYFLAGLKKTDMEWLDGYSMTNLGHHWVFEPFKLVLNTGQIDYIVVHWFGFLLDLTIGFWMILDVTRPVAMVFCASFHLMNSRLFNIGMFPYVCLATLPIFCAENWPRTLFRFLARKLDKNTQTIHSSTISNDFKEYKVFWKQKLTVAVLLIHCILQVFLPYSHFITKGYNNWTNGLYGYSWDMMVHSWDTVRVVVKVVDNEAKQEYYLDPNAWTQNDRWNKHADMCLQYAYCLENNFIQQLGQEDIPPASVNISVYIDVWCSMNGRFQQRMYDPNYDLLKASWSPFKPVEWLKPILTEYNNLRKQIAEITAEVHSWSNYSDVLFVADFPGLYLEHFISEDLDNVTVTVLEGEIYYLVENEEQRQSYGLKLNTNETTPVGIGVFHKIHVVSKTPACYMYVYVNKTSENLGELPIVADKEPRTYSPFPLLEDIDFRKKSFSRMVEQISNAFGHLLFGTPLKMRSRLD